MLSFFFLQPAESRFSARQERLLRTLDLCLCLDDIALPPSVSPIPHLHHTPPQPRPVNPELLITLKSLLGEDAVTDSVIEQGLYFIGKMEERSRRPPFCFTVWTLTLISIIFSSSFSPRPRLRGYAASENKRRANCEVTYTGLHKY